MKIALAMIVKDEAQSIAKTIASVRGIVDVVVLVDTGSTDDTPRIAREAAQHAGLELVMVHQPFVAFDVTRNVAVELAEQHADWVLMLSGNETVAFVEGLRDYLDRSDRKAHLVRVHFGDECGYQSVRLSARGAGWRYVGATHEVMVGPSGEHTDSLAPVIVHHDRSGDTIDSLRAKWARDLVALEQSTRLSFYRAQTLQNLGRYVEAMAAYTLRIYQGGWREEVYESKFRLAQCAAALGKPWPEVQSLYLEAFAFSPHRAEPLVAIAQHWRDAEDHHMAYLFASRACSLDYPTQDRLFVLRRDYDVRRWELLSISAWYVGRAERHIGMAAAEIALRANPDAEHLKNNLRIYKEAS